MGLSFKNITMALFLSGFIFIGMFSATQLWIAEHEKTLSSDLLELEQTLANTTNVVYASSKEDHQTMEDSKIYTGSTEIGIISADAYKVVKNSLKSTALVSNVTTSLVRHGQLPGWTYMLVIGAFIISLTFLALAAVFRNRGGIL